MLSFLAVAVVATLVWSGLTGGLAADQRAVLLAEEVLAEVGHAQWVFVIPKMLRAYFLRHRELLGGLARAGWERCATGASGATRVRG